MNIDEVKSFIDKYKKHCGKTYEAIEECKECELEPICFQLQRVERQLDKIDECNKK